MTCGFECSGDDEAVHYGWYHCTPESRKMLAAERWLLDQSEGREMKKWQIHSDLNGRCWIPPIREGGEGWYEEVPRRLYITTPWLQLTLALPGHGPASLRRRP